jgi:predicted GH43/DUF377 family glycosyl hydrolase
MKWSKKGLIYNCEGKNGFDNSHCHKPTPLVINDETLRIYFGVRDENNKTRTTFIDVDINDLSRIKYVHDEPVLDLGKIGAFDDSGANVSSVIRNGKSIYMYYIGWNPSTTVHTRNSIGLAVSKDNGFTFERLYDGPILDRNKEEPYYTGAVDVMKEGDFWKMWYTSGAKWKVIDGRPEIWYHIKYAYSNNGIDWHRDNQCCIPPLDEFEATARPCVIKDDNTYKMFYSKRDIRKFRDNKMHNYRAGYAESSDGINWVRLDEKVGIDVSKEGWDSDAIAYPYVLRVGGGVMLYNGNGFGKSGFGYAELLDKDR